MTKSKTDKHLTLSYKKLSPKVTHPLKTEKSPPLADSFVLQKNKMTKSKTDKHLTLLQKNYLQK